MQFQLIKTDNCPRLVLLFAGWGMTPRLFEGLDVPGYDLGVVYDYTTPDAAWTGTLGRYGEIAVVAWSYGVPAAAQFVTDHPELPVTSRIAVNGTAHPVHSQYGIEPEIFAGTLAGLDSRSVRKFDMRMCGGAAAYRQVEHLLGDRDPEALRAELEAIGARSYPVMLWDLGVVSDADLIITAEAQRRAWHNEAVRTMKISGPHLPDFRRLLAGLLTDKSLVARRFGKAEKTYDANADLQHAISDRLFGMATPREGMDILEVGAGTGRATRRLMTLRPKSLKVWDLHIPPTLEEFGLQTAECDAEAAIATLPDSSVDLIFSASAVQWLNSLPAFVRQAARVLRPGGELVISTFGPATMHEVVSDSGGRRGFHTTAEMARMMPDTMSIATLTEETTVRTFDTPLDVMRHIRATGVNAIDGSADSAAALRVIRDYPLDPTGKAPLTYQAIYLKAVRL